MSGVFNVIPNAIPEPGTLALLGMALFGLGLYAWRRRVPKIAVAAILLVAGLGFCTGTARAEMLGPNGIVAPTGINPTTGEEWKAGDTYHLAFVTSTTRDATSANIADYNTFVNTVANSTGSLVKDSGVTWNAIVSVIGGPDARTNTGTSWTVAAPGHPIFLLDSFCIATSYQDLWDGKIAKRPNGAGLCVTERGSATAGDNDVWTGTSASGTISMGLGNPVSGENTAVGATKRSDAARWIYHNVGFDGSTNKKFYALSEPLTIAGAIPEPGTLALLGMAVLGLGWYAWRRRRR